MKISALIEELMDIQAKLGDVDIHCPDRTPPVTNLVVVSEIEVQPFNTVVLS